MTWKTGRSYEGNYVKGQRHGEGTFTWEDGGKYVGKFEYGNECGGWYYFQTEQSHYAAGPEMANGELHLPTVRFGGVFLSP